MNNLLIKFYSLLALYLPTANLFPCGERSALNGQRSAVRKTLGRAISCYIDSLAACAARRCSVMSEGVKPASTFYGQQLSPKLQINRVVGRQTLVLAFCRRRNGLTHSGQLSAVSKLKAMAVIKSYRATTKADDYTFGICLWLAAHPSTACYSFSALGSSLALELNWWLRADSLKRLLISFVQCTNKNLPISIVQCTIISRLSQESSEMMFFLQAYQA